ncbi:hypothetical protein HCH44_15030 [Sphingomonas melonis]|jgi:hypothetical protein|uniref:hypothetical protein n=1 Tax=Sphingomonas melonis TaxID=152682 RepID=UPI000380A4E0|nr:hypothetical protein [Sphingomonas melonis]ATI54199.1 hypothetical protein CP552_00305 [Sphingomonas melonis]MBX8846224.1 hypothetical protein [Sphingomonas melonis]MBX8855382.1 hypothetical protein [Sphingomonas melonis]
MWVGKIENAILYLQTIILSAEVAAATKDPEERRSRAFDFYRLHYLDERTQMTSEEEAAFAEWLRETFAPG